MSSKLGLALGGGGSRGVCHVGVLKALDEAGIHPDFITGCSMGAVIGACYAKGMTPDEMMDSIYDLKRSKFVDISVAPISHRALLRGNKLNRVLFGCIGDVTFDQLKIPYACIASDMLSGRLVTINSGNVLEAVRASTAIPTIFPPVKKDGMLLIDGGVLCRVPTVQVREMGAEKVIAVDALLNAKNSVEDVKNVFSVIMRVFDMMDYNCSTMKRELLGEQNEVWIEPPMEGLNQYEFKGYKEAYEDGYKTAVQNMDKIERLIKDGSV